MLPKNPGLGHVYRGHTDKDAREHFQLLTHKRLVDIIDATDKTIDSLMHLELPAGVGIEIRM